MSDQKGLQRNYEERTKGAREKALQAINILKAEGHQVNFSSVSKESGVSRHFLYGDDEVRGIIEEQRKCDVDNSINRRARYDKTAKSKDVIISAKDKKIAKLTEKDLQKKYVQTVIDAGNQVNQAMADCMAAREKFQYYRRQLQVLHEAYKGTHELMDNGKASYLEVLTAQESLLNSQLNEAMNMYNASQAVIALYIALGGGTK